MANVNSSVKITLGGNTYNIRGVSEADKAKIQGAIQQAADNRAAISALQTAVAESNQLQHIIAGSDLGAQDAVISGLTAGALYDVYYNAAGRYLTYNSATGTFSDAGAGAETPDAVPATLKVFAALTATTVAAPRIYEMTSSFDGFVKTSGAQTVAGVKTFSDTPVITEAQDIATIGANDVVKGSVATGIDTRLQAAESAVSALQTSNGNKLQAEAAASEPADADMVAGTLYFYAAADLLTAATSA